MYSKLHLLKSKRSLLIGACLIVALGVGILEATNTTYIFHKKPTPETIPTTKTSSSGQDSSSKANSQNNASSTSQRNKIASSTGGEAASGLTLVEPYGTFVSNYSPGKSGTPYSIESVCNSTPGATCFIQFTNTGTGAITKLPEQTIGPDGSTIWSWDAKILPSGKWKITVTATLDGKSKSTTDKMNMEIP